MLSTRNVIRSLGLAAGMLAIAGMAGAATVTQTFVVPSQAASFSQPFNYHLFDSNTGVLTGVTIEIATTSTAEVETINISGTPQAFTNATASFPLTVSGPPGVTTYITSTIVAGPVSGTANPGIESFPAPPVNNDSGPVPILPSTIWPGNYEKSGGGFALGQILVAVGNGNYAGNAPSSVFFGGSGNVGGLVTLVYTYTPFTTQGTPEPGTWALIVASASVSLAGLRRRRALKG